MNITKEKITSFKNHLISEERSSATIEKYVRDVTAFSEWLCGREADRIAVVEYCRNVVHFRVISRINRDMIILLTNEVDNVEPIGKIPDRLFYNLVFRKSRALRSSLEIFTCVSPRSSAH